MNIGIIIIIVVICGLIPLLDVENILLTGRVNLFKRSNLVYGRKEFVKSL